MRGVIAGLRFMFTWIYVFSSSNLGFGIWSWSTYDSGSIYYSKVTLLSIVVTPGSVN